MKYIISKGIYTNYSQEKAIDKLIEFSNSDCNAITLKGRGGTGKTTIMKIFINKLMQKNKFINVVLLAPTHKAKNIFSNSSGRQVHTIASALGITLNESTGKFTIDYDKQNGLIVNNADYVIIDESSMLSDKLLNHLLDCIKIECKIVFMGDNAQLPPIGQDEDSEVFNLEEVIELTEQMRQNKDSHILKICDLLAENIESENIINRVIDNRTSKYDGVKNEGVLFLKDTKSLIKHYVVDFNRNPKSTKAITFNNQNHKSTQSVKSLNNLLRKYYLKYNKLDEDVDYHINEQLCCYDTLMNDKTNLPYLENSVDYTVLEAGEKVTKNMNFSKNTKKGIDKISFDVEFIKCTLENNITNEVVSIDLLSRKSHEYVNTIKNKLILEERFPLFYSIVNVIPNMEYAYAITSHKSQGSTYRNTYVFEDNILNQFHSNKKVKNQSLYVACSRASDKLVIFSAHN